MANNPQAKKRVRQTARRTEVNRNRRSRVRTFIKKVEAALDAGDHATASAALVAAQPVIQRGVSKGVMHGNTADRKISRLANRVNALKA